eukprot:667933-Rhodomonas_salina.3
MRTPRRAHTTTSLSQVGLVPLLAYAPTTSYLYLPMQLLLTRTSSCLRSSYYLLPLLAYAAPTTPPTSTCLAPTTSYLYLPMQLLLPSTSTCLCSSKYLVPLLAYAAPTTPRTSTCLCSSYYLVPLLAYAAPTTSYLYLPMQLILPPTSTSLRSSYRIRRTDLGFNATAEIAYGAITETAYGATGRMH